MHTRFDVFCAQDFDAREYYVEIQCLGCRSKASLKVPEKEVFNDPTLLRHVANELQDAHVQAYL